eukprot:gnl/TRDRNA2_/TRDRNA2_67580_c0_seq1.p1 gnl/TRDRNA2_/TRDRNA2_67580_c0~~gnl/TRDRNA2_/TRDRNA2_67580_c0_seq1.p1  ORF type:complete len:283 (-),score=11.36 gnl/TRDRNA2_/TRDRNA2_67580_c0_seq1:132-980(-)
MWRPDFEINNFVTVEETAEPPVVWNNAGLVRMAIRYRGDIFQPLNMRYFPFDLHCVWIKAGPVHSRSGSLVFTSGPSVFTLAGTQLGGKKGGSLILTESALGGLPGWRVCYLQLSKEMVTGGTEVLGQNDFSRVQVAFGIVRDPRYFQFRLIFPMTCLEVICLTSFALPLEDLSGRQSITVAMLLTAVALQFVIKEELPRAGSLTRIDFFLLRCFLLMFVQAVGHCAMYVLCSRLSTVSNATGQWLDLIFAVLLLIAFIRVCYPMSRYSLGHRKFPDGVVEL